MENLEEYLREKGYSEDRIQAILEVYLICTEDKYGVAI